MLLVSMLENELICKILFRSIEMRINVANFQELLDRIKKTDLTLGTPSTGLGLIERLLLNGINDRQLSKVLGLWQEGDDKLAMDRATSAMTVYYRHRWNIEVEHKVVDFLVTQYVGEWL